MIRAASCLLALLLFVTAAGCNGGSGSGGAPRASTSRNSGPIPQASPPETESAAGGSAGTAPVSSSSDAPVATSSGTAPLTTSIGSAATVSSLTFAEARVAASFDFATTRSLQLAITANEAQGGPAAHRRVQLSSLTGSVLYSGRTDASGRAETTLLVSTALERVRVSIDALGIPSWQDVAVADSLTLHFGPH